MFTELRIPAGRRPLTDSETRISTTIGIVITLIFIAAILDDYSPEKLSIPFFVLFWVPMLVVHELGHALAARAAGWRVREIVIGFGRTLWRWQIGDTRIRIKLAPVEGYVLPEAVDASGIRLKTALVYAAGPGAELAVLVLMILVLGPDAIFGQSPDIGSVAIKTLAFVIIIGAGFNLLPFRTEGGVSDGLGILSSPFMTGETIQNRILAAELREAETLIDADRPGEAAGLLAPLLARYPDNGHLRRTSVLAMSLDGRRDEAREIVCDRLADERAGDLSRREWLKLQALVELHAPRPLNMTLDLALQKALKITPDATDLLAIKGASLVMRGQHEAGGELLARAWRQGGSPADDPLMLAFLSVAARKVGDREATGHFLEAFEATNRSVALARTVAALMTG